MSEKANWKVHEIFDDIAHIQINGLNYFIDGEEACLAHAILCLVDEVRNVRDELMLIGEKMHVKR